MRRGFVGLAVLFAVGLTACGAEDSSNSGELRIPAPGTMVFTAGVDLWIQDDDGARLLIAAPQDQQLLHPAISPDGLWVAYIVFHLTAGEDTTIGTDVARARLDDPQPETLVRHTRQAEFLWYPRWSPDGGSLIFTHDAGELDVRIVLLELAERELTVLRSDARDADISPDGQSLVFINAPFSGDPHLMTHELSSGEERALDPDRSWQPRPFRIPRYSADGRSVIFAAGQNLPEVSTNAIAAARRNGPEDIWSVDLDSGELTQLAAVGEDQPDFALSDDGRHVLILGAFGVYLVATPPTDPPFAIAPGEFHGSIDWHGVVSDEAWSAVRESVLER